MGRYAKVLQAAGSLAVAEITRANPDGYTILAYGSALTIAPALYKALPYDAARDFAPIVMVGIGESVRTRGRAECVLTSPEAAPEAPATARAARSSRELPPPRPPGSG